MSQFGGAEVTSTSGRSEHEERPQVKNLKHASLFGMATPSNTAPALRVPACGSPSPAPPDPLRRKVEVPNCEVEPLFDSPEVLQGEVEVPNCEVEPLFASPEVP